MGPDRAVRYLLHRHGLSRSQLKELKLAMRLVLLEQTIADLRAAKPCVCHLAQAAVRSDCDLIAI